MEKICIEWLSTAQGNYIMIAFVKDLTAIFKVAVLLPCGAMMFHRETFYETSDLLLLEEIYSNNNTPNLLKIKKEVWKNFQAVV